MPYIIFFILALALGFCIAWAIYEMKTQPASLKKNALSEAVNPSSIFVRPVFSKQEDTADVLKQPAPLLPKTEIKQNGSIPLPGDELEDKLWRQAEIEYILNLNEQLALSLNRNKIAKCVVESVYKFLSVQRAVLLLLDKDTQQLRIEYACGLTEEPPADFFLKKEESISGLVITKREPMLTNNLEKDFYFLKHINKEQYLGKSFISVPIILQNEVLGVLHACGKKTGAEFIKRDLVFLANTGKISAIALRSSQLQEQIQNDYLKTITAFAKALDARDPYTRWHSENVAKYSLAIAKEMRLRQYEIEVLKQAALLHDIGKIGIRDNILLKESKLTEEEFEQIKYHPAKGEEIIKSLSFLKEASVLIRHHHEKYDGTGYPDGIKGNAIENGSRILAVADGFDAMTTDRPYRKQLPLDTVIKELEAKKGTQFDPEVVDAFLSVLKQNPPIFKPVSA